MSLKSCEYKDCTNYTHQNAASSNFTFFQFPKDPERRKLWFKLGEVPPQAESPNILMCSEHFDSKYISKNPRRTVLVGQAVPRAYVPKIETSQHEVEDDDELLVRMIYETEDKEREEFPMSYKVESTTTFNDDDIEDDTAIMDVYDDEDSNEKSEEHRDQYHCKQELEELANSTSSGTKLKPTVLKRKIVDLAPKYTKVKQQVLNAIPLSTNSNVLSTHANINNETLNFRLPSTSILPIATKSNQLKVNKIEKTTTVSAAENTSCIDESDLIDNEHVTTFIFRGEEYVQMPKDHYLQEKTALMSKIRQLENVIEIVKQSVNSLNM